MIKKHDIVSVMGDIINDRAIVVNEPQNPSEMRIFIDAETKNTFCSSNVIVKHKE